MTIDIEQARTNAIQMYAHLNDGKFADNLSYVMKALTELERLQKREVEMKEVIRKYQVENDNLHSWGVASTILDRFLKELESDEK